MTEAAHQCRTFPLPWIFRFTDPGPVAIVLQLRCVSIGTLRVLDVRLPADRVCCHFEQLIIQTHPLLAVMVVNAQ
ncbi:hypothetical protein D9M71_680050 [compost metagenome]